MSGSRSGSIVEMRTGMSARTRSNRRCCESEASDTDRPSRLLSIGSNRVRNLSATQPCGARVSQARAAIRRLRSAASLAREPRRARHGGIDAGAFASAGGRAGRALEASRVRRPADHGARARERAAHDPARAARRRWRRRALGSRPGPLRRRARVLARRRDAARARLGQVGLPAVRARRLREVRLPARGRGRVRELEPAHRSARRVARARGRDLGATTSARRRRPTARRASSGASWSSAACSRRASSGTA